MRTALLAILMGAACAAAAQYRIDWDTVDGGGGASSGGRFTLHGTAGQPDADEVSLCSADGGAGCVSPHFEVSGGFWTGAEQGTPPDDVIFRNGFEP